MASQTSEQTQLSPDVGNQYRRRAKEFVELHDQVQTSVSLLDSLEAFLSTFQKDLSAVSGQISELQDRSKDIENRLKSRRRIEKPLSSLISDITMPPALATLILDSPVGEPWIEAIEDFERRLETIKARSRVKAARDLGEVAEGLRIVAATKLRAFFLALFQPIRGSVTTNMQVIQTSVLLKYSGLFAFLQRQAPTVAHEVQRSYVGAARVYYETGFRRYTRSLGWIKARSIEKHETIVSSERDKDFHFDQERLAYAKIDGPGVTLAYMADDKTHIEPIEALLRSALLVFMDNATAEYTFVTAFFSVQTSLPTEESNNSLLSPTTLLSPDRATFADHRSITGSDYGGQRHISTSISSAIAAAESARKEEQAACDAIWKQIMDPVLGYCETFVKSVLDPVPPVVPLLTMIRLTEDVILEVQKRNCPPVEFFVFSLRLQMWPVFQKAMADNSDALKKLAEGTSTGYFSRALSITDIVVSNICKRYTVLFNSFINLTEQEEETMIFSNLLRLRQELSKLVLRHSNTISDVVTRATAQSAIYESLLQGLSKGTHLLAHPKSQQEIAYWANLEEEARRKIVSAGRSRPQR
ncbi:Vacuolar protein sorting-associated protein 52 A [Hypsizygus marmoreus]|uniref:Vacuolar protein sorting-associated protein 52 A n=1 Tax=Hypsizygus marmoreus TaxID=39966 RepID=A0A369JMV3_HYPMA|nr:Vacuolar protein sorting-associated protein 52 A [Hypsizygus marmoreus]